MVFGGFCGFWWFLVLKVAEKSGRQIPKTVAGASRSKILFAFTLDYYKMQLTLWKMTSNDISHYEA